MNCENCKYWKKFQRIGCWKFGTCTKLHVSKRNDRVCAAHEEKEDINK